MSPALLSVLVTEMVLAAAVWLLFVVHYHLTTRGAWARSGHGRNVMGLAATLAAMITFTLASTVIPAAVMLWVALLLWPILIFIGLHRHRLLWRDQHELFVPDPEVVERACEVMHDAYETAAVGAGWETRQASRKPWADVPEANKDTMRAAVAALLIHLNAPPEADR